MRFLAFVIVLNVIRYVVGGPIEMWTVAEPMHRVMPQYPEVFDADFTTKDFIISMGYNFMLWFSAALVFHLMHPVLSGGMIVKSLKSYAIMWLFFASLAAVYMNHYTDAVKPFYLYSILDAVIAFTIVALANGLLYPVFFKPKPTP